MGTIKIDGNLTIQNYNDQSGSSLAVAMPGGIVQQNMQSDYAGHEYDSHADHGKDSEPLIFLNSARGTKINLYRVIMAMHQLGFFVDKTGHQAKQKDVFKAFGEMLGADFSKYYKDISEASKKKGDITIFEELERAFKEYEEEKINHLEERR